MMPAATDPDVVTRALARVQRGELLNSTELAAILGIRHSRFALLAKAHAFDLFLVQPPIGQRRYSGIKVGKYLAGDPVYEPTFGARRAGKR